MKPHKFILKVIFIKFLSFKNHQKKEKSVKCEISFDEEEEETFWNVR